jgi:F-type H+-transporting ATPase subunit epsilon
MPIHCEIITQERKLYSEDVDIVIAPAAEGQMGILPQHAPMVVALTFGELRVRKGENEEYFAIGGGVMEVRPDKVIVLADRAERADQIDVDRAEQARRQAEQTMREGLPVDSAERAALEAAIRRNIVRMKVARRRAARRGTGPGALGFRDGEGS